jgi:hypothetical protein
MNIREEAKTVVGPLQQRRDKEKGTERERYCQLKSRDREIIYILNPGASSV